MHALYMDDPRCQIVIPNTSSPILGIFLACTPILDLPRTREAFDGANLLIPREELGHLHNDLQPSSSLPET